MTSTDATTTQPSFGVADRIGETFSVLRQRFLTFVILSAVPGILVQLASYATGLGTTNPLEADPAATAAMTQSVGTAIFVLGVLPILVYAVMTGMMVMAAYDTKAGRPVRFGAYLTATVRRLPALVIVTIIAALGITIGSMLFLVPGLWLAGVWAVCVPAIMIEGLGIGALARSSRLTKEYRWPIVGFVVLTYIIISVITFLVAMAAAFLPVPAILVAIILGLINGVTTALVSIAVSVAYARLRDIKEGVGYADLAEIFD
ncbi:hypothetical protein [Martelella mediterranea]|uniref:Glycerophosphoryl diester phosphodiesterase family protein n=1 Tax=Martelella mediterranea TaxID=293089 RepID=A0A4R3NRH8_9HYPH|nr:hypothetical protein [Martelella mediterranea]TCT34796.1 hypothetical protein EDC90_103040 [Martelella mediterranea]